MIDYNVAGFREWLNNNVALSNAYSSESLRALTEHIFMGRNYRLLTERNTKEKLLLTYTWIMDVVQNAKAEFGAENWYSLLLDDLRNTRRRTPEQTNLMSWLLGLTNKTATNLSISKDDYPQVLTEIRSYAVELFDNIERRESLEQAWLLMIGGGATLSIRGSDKSKTGKQLEKVVIKSLLTILGFEENRNFWVNIGRDNEVEREADAEVETRRGRLRIEVGLIAAGNQEVIEDKIGRMNRNDIVLFDIIGPRSRIRQTAQNANVNLVQIRNNQPIVEIHRLLAPMATFDLNDPPRTQQEINEAISMLPERIFNIAHFEQIDEN